MNFPPPFSRYVRSLVAVLLLSLLAACGSDDRDADSLPTPQTNIADAVGHYCGMALNEHTGPKGQIFLQGRANPVWFSAIKQVFAYTVLPEEPKTISAIYVNDMAGAELGQQADPNAWINAQEAYYVIESRYIGGMGAEDAMPFGQHAQAEAFAQAHGGRVVSFHDVPDRYIFSQ